jgi:hypothetical protein
MKGQLWLGRIESIARKCEGRRSRYVRRKFKIRVCVESANAPGGVEGTAVGVETRS